MFTKKEKTLKEKKTVTPIRNHISETIPVALAVGAGMSATICAGAVVMNHNSMEGDDPTTTAKTLAIVMGSTAILMAGSAITLAQLNAGKKTTLQKAVQAANYAAIAAEVPTIQDGEKK